MKNGFHPENLEIDGWPFRIQNPSQPNDKTKVLLLLHGHLGNENVMWVFTNPLPDTFFMLAPRAPIQLGANQFSWHDIQPQWPKITVYKNIADQFIRRVELWLQEHQINRVQLDVMGFSQGAVLAYALALLHPEKVRKIAGLSGFIPQTWQKNLSNQNLNGKQIFIAHGKQDEVVPINYARQAATWFREHGALVTLCETDTGHKVGVNCFNSLGAFFRK